MTLLGFLLLVAGLWAVGIAFALAVNKVGSGEPLPPERPAWTVTPYRAEADVVCEGCGADVAMTLLDLVRRDHADESVVRLVYQGETYVITRGRRRVVVRSIG